MPPPPLPLPLLTLRLSSPSFLETILTDAGYPVYSTETYHNTTSLSRCHPTHGLALVANIHWPDHNESFKGKGKETQPAQIFMDGSHRLEDDLLRRNVLNTSRKFHIPGHSHALKWKRLQGVFQCTSANGTLVAVFEPAILTARARLNVFVASLPGLPPSMDTSVSALLTDYLIVTALLLLTHPEDWRGIPPPSPLRDYATTPTTPTTATTAHSASVSPSTRTCTCTCTSPAFHGTRPVLDDEFKLPEDAVVVADFEPPPPYEEIQWTVRIRQPRPRRTFA